MDQVLFFELPHCNGYFPSSDPGGFGNPFLGQGKWDFNLVSEPVEFIKMKKGFFHTTEFKFPLSHVIPVPNLVGRYICYESERYLYYLG